MKYVIESHARALANQLGKRAGKDFLFALDVHIERMIKKACETHNGGKKTLDKDVATYIGLNR